MQSIHFTCCLGRAKLVGQAKDIAGRQELEYRAAQDAAEI